MYRFGVAFGCFVSIVLATGCACLEHRYMGCGLESGMTAPNTSCASGGGCGDCGDCGGKCAGYKPGHPLGNLLGCTSGCGEVYWGEWMSDPPDYCDPCDDHGNWGGYGCCGYGCGFPILQHVFGSLHAALSGQCAGTCGACDSCAYAGSPVAGTYYDEAYVSGYPAGQVYAAPTEAKQFSPASPPRKAGEPTPAPRPQTPYYEPQQQPSPMSFLNVPSHRGTQPPTAGRTITR